MPPAFFSAEYAQDLQQALNADPEFKQKTASLNLKVLMSVKDKDRHALLTIEKGNATVVQAKADTPADFKFIGEYAVWAANHRGEAPLEKLVMTGKLKFIGSMAKILGLRGQLVVIDKIAQGVPAEL